MTQERLTETFVRNAKCEPGKDRTIYWDEKNPGFGLMVTKGDAKSWVIQYRYHGRSRRMTLASASKLTPDKARKRARAELAKGDPLEVKRKEADEGKNTLKAVGRDYLERHKHLRSIKARGQVLDRLVFRSSLGSYAIATIKRSDIVRLLDKIEDENGATMADHVLGFLRHLLNWYANRADDYRTPIGRGMARTKPKERVRTRVLADDELRVIWRAAGATEGPFGKMLQFILLTATRRKEAAGIDRKETSPHTDERTGQITGFQWIIPKERYKTKVAHVVPLSRQAKAILEGMPKVGEHYFTNDGKKPFNSFSLAKKDLDDRIAALEGERLPGWTIHDLRRTARTLMARAKIDTEHAKRCLGHKLGGTDAHYNMWEYYDEKRHAFETLAALVERIIDPQANVVPLHGSAQ
jgi:integrase